MRFPPEPAIPADGSVRGIGRMEFADGRMLAEKADGIGWLTFNNPERRNAMSMEMWEGVDRILADFEADDSVRAIVLRGAGDRAFVSGADISQFGRNRADADAAARYAAVTEAGRRRLAGAEKPTIAMIRGFCLGGGLGIAMTCDLRFAQEESEFGIPAARLGIAYNFDNLRSLVQLVGPARAKDILFSGRRLPAREAYSIGLVDRVLPAEELEGHTRAYAGQIAVNAPLSIRASKLTINQVLMDRAERDPDLIAALGKACFDSGDYREGRTAFMEKRRPVFRGR